MRGTLSMPRPKLERYQQREPCPYCGKMVKRLQKLAHTRMECDKAPEEKRRESVPVSVRDKWRPHFS